MLGLSRKQMLSEVRFAVTAWGCLYLIMFGMLLVYRDNTHSYYVGQAKKAAELAAANGGDASVIKTKKVVKQVPRHNRLQQYEATIQKLTAELTTAHKSVLTRLETLNQYLGTLENWKESALLTQNINEMPPSSPPTADVAPPLEHWQQLLSLSSLQDIPSTAELDKLFETALGEMRDALTEPSAANWHQIQQSLQENPVRGRQDSELECPADNKKRRHKQLYPNAAYESDLQPFMAEADDYFSKRNPGAGLRALQGDSRKQVEDEAVERAGKMLQEILQFVDDMEKRVAVQQQGENGDDPAVDTDDDVPSCDTDLELVTALVDAGLKAMAAHGDVREAIRQTTLEYDPQIKEDDLILDADLPLTSTSNEQQESFTVNLRSVIDTPLLLQAMDWIDDLVDVVGGYNDKLDQYLDSLTDDHDHDENVGEVVIERLLRAAGLQEIDIQKVGEKIKLSPELQRKILEKYG